MAPPMGEHKYYNKLSMPLRVIVIVIAKVIISIGSRLYDWTAVVCFQYSFSGYYLQGK